MAKKYHSLIFLLVVLSSLVQVGWADPQTLEVGFAFDRSYYYRGDNGSVSVWAGWWEGPTNVTITTVGIHFDWMEGGSYTWMTGLDIVIRRHEGPKGVCNADFNVPEEIDDGWHSVYAVVMYSEPVNGQVVSRQFFTWETIFMVGREVGGALPNLYYGVLNFTESVPAGGTFTVRIELANDGGYVLPSIIIGFQVDGEMKPAIIPFEYFPSGLGQRREVAWDVPPNCSIGDHRFNILIFSGEVLWDNLTIPFTVTESLNETASRLLSQVSSGIDSLGNFLSLMSENDVTIDCESLPLARQEHRDAMNEFVGENYGSSIELAEKAMQHLNTSLLQVRDAAAQAIEATIAQMNEKTGDPIALQHLEAAAQSVELGKSSQDLEGVIGNLTEAQSQLLEADRILSRKRWGVLIASTAAGAGLIAILVARKIKKQ